MVKLKLNGYFNWESGEIDEVPRYVSVDVGVDEGYQIDVNYLYERLIGSLGVPRTYMGPNNEPNIIRNTQDFRDTFGELDHPS